MSLVDSGFNTVVHISHRKPVDLGATNRRQNREVAQALADLLMGANIGSADAVTAICNQAGVGSKAGATLIVSGGTGTIGGIINGVTVTGSGAGTDTQDAAVIAAAINASTNALVQGFVRAASTYGTVTLATMTAGSFISLRIGSGATANTYTFTATAAATGLPGEFSIAGSDTADALALADAINAYPVLNQTVRAESVAGACFIYMMDDVATNRVLTVNGSGITLTTAIAAATRVHIEAQVPGIQGNAITIALSGTGITVANTNTRLVGGTGPAPLPTATTIKRANLGGAQ